MDIFMTFLYIPAFLASIFLNTVRMHFQGYPESRISVQPAENLLCLI